MTEQWVPPAQTIEYLSNGKARFRGEGTPADRGWVYNDAMVEKWNEQQAKEKAEEEKRAQQQAEQERAAARKKARAEAAAKEKAMQEEAQEKQKKIQAKAKEDYIRDDRGAKDSANWAVQKDTYDLLQKHGHQEIVELYDRFPPGENLRGLAKALKIQGATNYETYQKAYDVYNKARQATGTFGTNTTEQEEHYADKMYRTTYVATAAGKCAEAGLAWVGTAKSGGAIGAADAIAKTGDAIAWGMQAKHVWETGDEDDELKAWQDATGSVADGTGILSLGKKAFDTGKKGLDPKNWQKLKDAYQDFKKNDITESAKKVMTLENGFDAYSDGATIYKLAGGGSETKAAEGQKPVQKYAATSKRVNEDGTITVRTTVTGDDDPDKEKKLVATTGETPEEIAKETAEISAPPEERPIEEVEEELTPYDQEHEEIMQWVNSPEFQLVLGAAEDMRQPFAIDKVVGTYYTNKAVAGGQGSYTFRVHKVDDNTIMISYSVVGSAEGYTSETYSDTVSAPYDPATGQVLDGSGIHFVNAGGNMCVSMGELGLVPRQ